jgi:hypothetical protein
MLLCFLLVSGRFSRYICPNLYGDSYIRNNRQRRLLHITQWQNTSVPKGSLPVAIAEQKKCTKDTKGMSELFGCSC